MEHIEFILKILSIISGPIIAAFGYQQYQIKAMQEKLNKVPTMEEVRQDLQDRVDFLKEKIEDNFSPLKESLDRLEHRLDKICDRLDRL